MIDKLFISFSGGETSALMTYLLLTQWRNRFSEAIVVFANTGEENEQTLEFVHKCDKHLNFNTIWVEAVPHRGRSGTTHRQTDFMSASRNGEPYEAVIEKYGIPNASYPHCTRELKQRPMESLMREMGWSQAHRAIGIRADESRRRGASADKLNIVYPLLDWKPTTKQQVNSFWRDMPFRLDLAGYQGNCKWCWKKSYRKLLTIIDETPEYFNFPERMEKLYGFVGPEFAKSVAPTYKRTFFRQNKTVHDLRLMASAANFDTAEDDSIIYHDEQIELDIDPDDGCVESCEVRWDE